MVPHLNSVNEPNEFDIFRSHSHKPLRVHTNGVLAGVERHTTAPIARVATLFHDTGKLNPNFQPKLDGKSTGGYDHHAYLSAFVFLSYCSKNPKLSELGLTNPAHVFAVLALIARHHGHLPHLRNIFSLDERVRLMDFLDSKPALPLSPFLAQWLAHQPFDALDNSNRPLMEKFNGLLDTHFQKVESLFDFWLETQFSFASLIESDKRDAGDNKRFQRDEQIEWAKDNFAPPLLATFAKLQDAEKPSDLNQLRNAIRNEAVLSLREQLKEDKRIFTLTAPTGAGKTFTLLALAEEIRRGRDHLSVVYGLPFLSITEQVEGICREIWEINEDFCLAV